nr:reverse transcriptase domain-containing protein [Tanacetum cinerariifolium]
MENAHVRLSIKVCCEKLNPTIKATKVNLKDSSSRILKRTSLEEQQCKGWNRSLNNLWSHQVSYQKRNQNYTSTDKANEGMKRAKRIPSTSKERVLSCVNAEEKVIVNDNHIKPIKYNERGLGPYRIMAAYKETEELTKAGILRKAKQQTWVANPVMVQKSDGGWRMCVHFTDINKACPKDCYPLPEIDWKIESLLGFRLKCFLDTYKGYHQIQMAEEDEDKTAFYAGEGVFSYKKTSFGLKNAGATYQRFRSININLNPKKCLFVVEEDSFLGHLITKHGIKANPSKVKAVIDLDQARTLKDIQSLNKKLAALSWFLSKGAERSLASSKYSKGKKIKRAYIG